MIMTDDSIVLSNRTLQFCLRPFLVILQEKFVAKARMSPQFFMRHCESMLVSLILLLGSHFYFWFLMQPIWIAFIDFNIEKQVHLTLWLFSN
jgi:hypothetical protein